MPIPARWPRPMRRCSCARADVSLWRMRERSTQESGGDGASRASRARSRGGTGPWSDLVFRPLGYSIPLGVKRGYHLHLKAERQRRAQSSGSGFRSRLFAGADEPGHSSDHRRRVCPPRCAADARSRSNGRCRGRALCFRWASRRCETMDGRAALPARHAAGDRAGAAPSRAVVRFRPSASWADAGAGDRPVAGGNDDRHDAVRRSRVRMRSNDSVDHIRLSSFGRLASCGRS